MCLFHQYCCFNDGNGIPQGTPHGGDSQTSSLTPLHCSNIPSHPFKSAILLLSSIIISCSFSLTNGKMAYFIHSGTKSGTLSSLNPTIPENSILFLPSDIPEILSISFVLTYTPPSGAGTRLHDGCGSQGVGQGLHTGATWLDGRPQQVFSATPPRLPPDQSGGDGSVRDTLR